MIEGTRKQILLVGAYERDNFGDVLFGILTKQALEDRGHTVVLSSVVMADMRHIFGEVVVPYTYALTHYTWDVVWVVGGEVAGTSVDKSLSMTLPGSSYSRLQDLTAAEQDSAARHVIGAPSSAAVAYIPNLARYERNTEAMLIINSSGGFREKGRAKRLVNRAAHVHVATRDDVSYAALSDASVDSVALTPDLVHTIPGVLPKPEQVENRLLFQASDAHLREALMECVISQLGAVAQRHSCGISLFAAGYAPHHDSLEKYERIKAGIESQHPGVQVDIPAERDPLELVTMIASARLWLGSSLHGRIISGAYNVPRVSFSKPKLNRYIGHWDPDMPYGVELTDFIDAVDQAMSSESDVSQQLAEPSGKNFRRLIDIAEKAPRRSHSQVNPAEVEREALLDSFSKSSGLIDQVGSLQQQVRAKSRKNSRLTAQNVDLRQKLGE